MSALLWWCDFTYTICRVTLPTERVSWNFITIYNIQSKIKSRSPRSVWVEMGNNRRWCKKQAVTLPTERVSWNWYYKFPIVRHCCHAPHGACELKFSYRRKKSADIFVTLPTERVSWNLYTTTGLSVVLSSRSPRSVWVEIHFYVPPKILKSVTLPTERVSWNYLIWRYVL